MRISIDLDDTILVKQNFPFKEPNTTPLIRGGITEYFRAGTVKLFQYLIKNDFEVGIYTNSYRGKPALEKWFKENDFYVDFVINKQIHDGVVDLQPNRYSLPAKCPHLFEIDVHIDDLHEIKTACEKFGTKVILVDYSQDWVEKIIKEISKLKT